MLICLIALILYVIIKLFLLCHGPFWFHCFFVLLVSPAFMSLCLLSVFWVLLLYFEGWFCCSLSFIVNICPVHMCLIIRLPQCVHVVPSLLCLLCSSCCRFQIPVLFGFKCFCFFFISQWRLVSTEVLSSALGSFLHHHSPRQFMHMDVGPRREPWCHI